MVREIISNFKVLTKKFPELKKESDNHPRIKALQTYFKRGGVISAVKGNKWPKLIYPTEERLQRQINELSGLIRNLEGKKREWQKTFFDAQIYNVKNSVLKFLDPLFWQHVSQTVVDKDYREDAKTVQLPMQMVAEPKYRPMINMFVKDLDYRKQLTETVQHSIVYKKDRRVAKYAQDVREFRMSTSNKNIETLTKKLVALDKEFQTLQTILTWAKEK